MSHFSRRQVRRRASASASTASRSLLAAVEERHEIQLPVGAAVLGVEEADELVGGQGAAAGHVHQADAHAAHVLGGGIGLVDELGAHQGGVGEEVEVEVVGPALEVEGAGDGAGLVHRGQAGAQHAQVVHVQAVLGAGEGHALADGLDDADGVAVASGAE